MTESRIYLDYNATTPVDPRVLEAMLPFFTQRPGNPASRHHAFGWEAEEAVQQARQQLAALIGAQAEELTFTSGATESLNLAIRGVYDLYRRKGRHLVTVKTEHNAVLDTCEQLEKQGAEVTYLDVRPDGRIDLSELDAAIRPDTVLVAVMWANNETGVLQPMAEIGAVCEKHGTLLLSDATQAVGKIPVDVTAAGVHLLACTAHKMYGPKGVGALYLRRRRPRVKVRPLITGGGHESGVRSGTLNVPGIVGFGKAAEIARSEMQKEGERLRKLRDRLEIALLDRLDAVERNGDPAHRLPHVSNLSFRCVDSEALLMRFNQHIAVATGSACTSASLDPSHVLTAMGRSDELAHGAVRFSLGRYTTETEIDQTIESVISAVNQLRAVSPMWEMYLSGG